MIPISVIAEFFSEEISILKKGENSLASGNLIGFSYNPEFSTLQGKVSASMKLKTYEVKLTINNDCITEYSCECPRGQGKCHHMATLLLHAHENISRTDIMCSWRKPTAGCSEVVRTSVGEMFPKKEYSALKRDVEKSDIDFFVDGLKKISFTYFQWMLADEPTPAVEDFKKKQIFSLLKEYRPTLCGALNINLFLAKLKLSANEVAQIESSTKGQRKNPLWQQMRHGRLTTSHFGEILAAVKRNRYPPSLFKNLLGEYNLSGVKSVEWGINNERIALAKFMETTDLNVEECGLFLDESGMLGASPDGLIGSDAIVEVKCPFRLRNATAHEVIDDPKYCFNGEWEIKKNHVYYDQIQGQLHITGRSVCYFVVYTSIDEIIVPVEKDELWLPNLERLKNFYTNEFLNHLITLQGGGLRD